MPKVFTFASAFENERYCKADGSSSRERIKKEFFEKIYIQTVVVQEACRICRRAMKTG